MRAIIINNGTSYIDQLQELLSEYCDEVITQSYEVADYQNILPSDLVVLSGGHIYPVANHDDVYQQELKLISQHQGSLLGVCLGFQLIAHAYGAELNLMQNRRRGVIKVELVDSQLAQQLHYVEAYESHRWCVPSVPPPLEALGYSNDGVELLRHESRLVYGMQFHPEQSDDSAMRRLLGEIIGRF